jgi:hypothetical protein
MSSRQARTVLIIACIVQASLLIGAARAAHVASHQCGVTSSTFARICRPSAHASCLRAVKRGVAGFTEKVCADRKAACSTCLSRIHTCISRIGHWPVWTHSCDRCKARFDRCLKRRYPQTP